MTTQIPSIGTERSDANRLALRAVRAILDAAAPTKLLVEGTTIDVEIERLPAAPWPATGLEGLDEATDGPLPRPLRVKCSWSGGSTVLLVSIGWWGAGSSYHRLIGVRTVVASAKREIGWITVALPLRKGTDGTNITIPASFSLFKKKDGDAPSMERALLKAAVERSDLPSLTPWSIEGFAVTLPQGDVLPSPMTGFVRLIHLALLKLPFFLRGEPAGIEGSPPFDIGVLAVDVDDDDEGELLIDPTDERRSGLYPLPGGVREYKKTLDALLLELREQPLTEDELFAHIRERYKVTGQTARKAYADLLQNLGFVCVLDGRLALSSDGKAYLESPEPRALFERLHQAFTGLLEVLVIAGTLGRAGTLLTRDILPALLERAWKTNNQTMFRRNWLLSCGATERRDDGDVLTDLGRRILADHQAEVTPIRARIDEIVAERGLQIPEREEDEAESDEGNEPPVEDEDSNAELISQPFEPTKIRIETRTITVDLLVRRIQANEIDLSPDFQRTAGLWRDGAQSRLIESLLIRIPVPAFYMDATDDDRWLVVDGLQRLTVLRRFVVDKELALTELEFLTELTGKTFAQLPRPMQRRIEETQVTVNLIQPGTPSDVKFNIFKRINTGGLPLSPQEIRHALNQGAAARMLQDLAMLPEFGRVAGRSIKNQRMTDRECVLRFLAFVLTPYMAYKSSQLDGFLNEQMKRLNGMSEQERGLLRARFSRAMVVAHEVFGADAFRKRYQIEDHRKPINKALFECWSVALDALSDQEIEVLLERRDALLAAFVRLMNVREFDAAISQGTGDPRKVQLRFSAVERIVRETIS